MKQDVGNNHKSAFADIHKLCSTLELTMLIGELGMECRSTLLYRFLDISSSDGDLNALFYRGKYISYGELRKRSLRVANTLLKVGFHVGDRCLLLAGISDVPYAGLLGVLYAGGCFVPANAHYPEDRNFFIAENSDSRFCVVDSATFPLSQQLFNRLYDRVFIFESNAELLSVAERFDLSNVKVISCEDQFEVDEKHLPKRDPDDYFYLLYTSGSTGTPKGVGIKDRNVEEYFSILSKICKPGRNDRLIQLCDLTFDVAEHSIWRALSYGACLYLPDDNDRFMPASYMKEHRINEFMAVPSVAANMNRLRILKSNVFPDLKFSFFCGEALPTDVALAWCDAAKNSHVYNLYGPTEATIACLVYKVEKKQLDLDAVNVSTPIGQTFSSMVARVVDESFVDVNDGEIGELLISGKQLATGYWNLPAQTEKSFINLGDGRIWYRTGDLVRKKGCCYSYIGRMGTQIKVRGYRVELSEIEFALSKIISNSQVVVVPRFSQGLVTGTVAFIPSECTLSDETLIEKMALSLPNYMVPSLIKRLDLFPLNINGKVDRKRLTDEINETGNDIG